MSYEPLHHKYRPQTFAELVGQAAIAATLTNAIRQQKIAPAYLFTGARGTGKTSSARILAKSLNCLASDVPTAEPCGGCEVCRAIARGSALDIVEIDAASNTGVDNIRELIERAQFAPVQCRYKVYIIDEVHMLSTAAFNALLKTLEEPPDRVVFVLATTDPQRVLPTIISRCQRFDYRRIPLDAMTEHLRYIADQEAIAIADSAITLIGQMAQGGLRDAESLLDQLSLLSGEIAVEQVWDLVGSVPERDLLELLRAIAQDSPETVLDSTRRLMDRGREPLIVLQNLASFYRDLLIAKTAPTRADLVALTPPTWQQLCELAQTLAIETILQGQHHLRSAEGQVKNTTQPRLWLEVTLLGLLPSASASRLPTAGSGQTAASNGQKIASTGREPNSANLVPATLPAPKTPEPQTPEPRISPDRPANLESAAAIPATPSAQPASHSPVSEPRDLAELPAAIGLEQRWQQILAHIDLQGTRAMLSVNCYLLSLDDQSVNIGVKTQNMLKMIKGMLPQLEGACVKAFKTKPKISLEVAALPTTASPSPAAAQSSSDPSARSAPSLAPQNPAKSPTASESRPSGKPSAGQASPGQASTDQARSPAPLAETAIPSGRSPDPPPTRLENPWQTEDPVTRAAKNLAEFFAGQVVDDNDTLSPVNAPIAEPLIEPEPEVYDLEEEPETANLPVWSGSSSLALDDGNDNDDDHDDDDDVPF